MRRAMILLLMVVIFTSLAGTVHAQVKRVSSPTPTINLTQTPATQSAEAASKSAEKKEEIEKVKKEDVTRVEEDEQKKEVLKLFSNRLANELTYTNSVAYFVQSSVKSGVPASTVVLILLLPLLATIVLFFRHVVGVPSLAMILPIALSITLLATGLTVGLILLAAIILSSTMARLILKKIRIMQLSKAALTVFLVALSTLVVLSVSAFAGIVAVTQISIFPVLLLILLSQNLVELQLNRAPSDTVLISIITVSLGILGYFLLSFDSLRNLVILYPEIVLLLVPINIIIGRYFGLRFTEYFRFSSITQDGR